MLNLLRLGLSRMFVFFKEHFLLSYKLWYFLWPLEWLADIQYVSVMNSISTKTKAAMQRLTGDVRFRKPIPQRCHSRFLCERMLVICSPFSSREFLECLPCP